MEQVIVNEQSSVDVSGNSASVKPTLQRYPLRSANKLKEQKPDASDSINPSQSKRGRNTPNVSKSVGVLELSGKGKSSSAKPPRRLSIPVKASATPSPKAVGNTTPISETRSRRSGSGQGSQTRIPTPVSEIFRSSARMKFSLLSSASYWLNQIKLSESAAKHNISLGFFKLALEAGCEPFQKLQDELKSYLRRHQAELTELGEPVKELRESYNIAEIIEQSQVSESISQMPEEGTRSSDDEVHYSSSTMATGKLTPKCLNPDSPQLSTPPAPILESTKTDTDQSTSPAPIVESTKKDISQSTPPAPIIETTKKGTSQKKNLGSKLRENLRMNSANSKPATDSVNRRSVKRSEKPSKPETNKTGVKKHGRKAGVKEVPVSPTTSAGEKENMDVRSTADDLIEVL
ncbi:hypothetical protein TSUD_193170 [Trifolium subterraneum]|uniref:Uncharacterized protein n=1 Tax=Trifolium subterraneum TaxID=3900 RepID=A0A2Z6PCE0_TRISU|nr:hypothetical protein TSUD_193170 [Trifolium subterraneum]